MCSISENLQYSLGIIVIFHLLFLKCNICKIKCNIKCYIYLHKYTKKRKKLTLEYEELH